MPLTFEIKGMHCKSCKMLVEDVLDELEIKIISLVVNESEQRGMLQVDDAQNPQKIMKAIEEEGEYKVKQI